MRIRVETGASIEELRRFAGWPDVSPLQELASLAFEQWLVSQLSATIRGLRASGQLSHGDGLDGGAWPDEAGGGNHG